MVRIVIAGGAPRIDERGRLPGRAAYLCPDRRCLQIAVKKRAVQRSLGVSIAPPRVRGGLSSGDMDALIEGLQARCVETEPGKEVKADGEDQGP